MGQRSATTAIDGGPTARTNAISILYLGAAASPVAITYAVKGFEKIVLQLWGHQCCSKPVLLVRDIWFGGDNSRSPHVEKRRGKPRAHPPDSWNHMYACRNILHSLSFADRSSPSSVAFPRMLVRVDGIPYCKFCRDKGPSGVNIEEVTSSRVTLIFKNPEYGKMFEQANPFILPR